MSAILFLVVVASAAWIICFALRSFRRFDAKIQYIYEHEYERWTALGKPMGYFWKPKEKVPFFSSFLARDSLYMNFSRNELEPQKNQNKKISLPKH
jgi:3-oxoacyl-ACP reductase-like protein